MADQEGIDNPKPPKKPKPPKADVNSILQDQGEDALKKLIDDLPPQGGAAGHNVVPIGTPQGKQGSGYKARAKGGASGNPPDRKLSEFDLTEAFIAAHGKQFLHAEKLKQWFEVDPASIWRPVGKNRMMAAAMDFISCTADVKPRDETARTCQAVLALVAARVRAEPDEFDRDRWLLGTPHGVIDLKNISQGPVARPDMRVTKTCAVSPAGGCPLWLAFLDQVTGGDRAMQDYLQRSAGYSLTGSTQEDVLLFVYGVGANGKSVFTGTLAGVLGEYCKSAPMEMFCVTHNDRHPSEIAALRGARMVLATETEQGARLAEAKLKNLTGGEAVSARVMRGDWFEFVPQLTLWISGNHKPSLRSVDVAIERRMRLIPFEITIPEAQRDPALSEKLKAEWPGILKWALDGCAVWQASGLGTPQAVTAATSDYFEDQSDIGQWVAEACDLGPNHKTGTRTLYRHYAAWAKDGGGFVKSEKAFSLELEKIQGLRKYKGNRSKGFWGIGLCQ